MTLLYNQIGIDYNFTRKADPYITSRLLFHLGSKTKGKYLDIGCGTGNYTIQLHNKGFDFMGIDPSDKMLTEAQIKNESLVWQLGSAENTMLQNESIDGVVASLTIHHWSSLENGMFEMYRILKKEGKLVIFTAASEQMQNYWLNYYFPEMMQSSIIQMPSMKRISQTLKKTGFRIVETEKYDIQDDLEDLFLYSGKHRPELYLKPEIRRGISSFSSLANEQEITNGLVKLENDIKTGKIKSVIDDYKTNLGDYLFIVACK